MDPKQRVIANVKYQSPKGQGAAKLKGILRYIQYRNDRDGHIPQERGLERWVDHGLGGNFQTTAANCELFKSEHVQAFTLVINPNPDLVDMIPEKKRARFVRELTENTIEQFFEARELDTPEWSYALHQRETTEDGRDNPHTHIILPGTYESWSDGGRLPLYFNNRKADNHIELLHEVAQQQTGILMEQYVGKQWERRYDALHPPEATPGQAILTDLETTLGTLAPAPDADPHFTQHTPQDQDNKQLWIAIQGDLDPDIYHVGIITREEGKNGSRQTFQPLIENLEQDQADIFATVMKNKLQSQPQGYQTVLDLSQSWQQSSPQQRQRFWDELEQLQQQDHEPQNQQSSDMNIDFDL